MQDKLSRADQARVNGAQSNGPTSPEGKAAIRRNAVSHGFRSKSVHLINEDGPAYQRHLDAYLQRYSPIDKVEEDLVGLLASNMWNVMRMNTIEVAFFDQGIWKSEEEILRDHPDCGKVNEGFRLANVFKRAAGDNALELLRRYKSTAERAYHRAFVALEQIRRERNATTPPPAAEPKIAEQTREPIAATTKPPIPETIEKSVKQPISIESHRQFNVPPS